MKNKRIQSRKKKTNPLSRKSVIPRGPRTNFDGTVVNSSWYASPTTAVANVASSVLIVDASGINTGTAPISIYSAQVNTTNITRYYNEYYYKTLHLHWLPSVAPGVAAAGGRVTAAYFENPEMVNQMIGATVANQILAVKGVQNNQSWNAWENHIYKVPLKRRRRWFDVDAQGSSTTIDNLDRTCQGVVVVVFETIGATDTVGLINPKLEIVVRGLTTAAIT